MDSDVKLMVVEYASMFLEQALKKEFPRMGRRAMLQKYQFLSLDGARSPKFSKRSAGDRIRDDYHELLCRLAKGEKTSNGEHILGALEKCDRWIDTDEMIVALDKACVKLVL